MLKAAVSIAVSLVGVMAASTGACADEIVRLGTRPGVEQPFLLLEPRTAAKGVVILLPGHDGEVVFSQGADGDYEVRNIGGGLTAHRAMRETLRKRGFAVAVIAPPSDRTRLDVDFRKGDEHFEDMRQVVAHLRKRYGADPYLQGHCLGTLSAASVATRLKGEGLSGLILSSTRSIGEEGSVTDFGGGGVRVPVLLVHHREDSCPKSPYYRVERVQAFYRASAPRVDIITVSGGVSKMKKKQDSCQDGFHGFKGMQKDSAQAIAKWLRDEDFPALVEARR